MIDCVIEEPRWESIGLAALAETAEAATFGRLGLDPARFEAALLACDDARIAALNADFRGKAQPTNVLSWPSEERAPEQPGAVPDLPEGDVPPLELGDIALAYETCAREALDAGRDLPHHAAHLIVHGLLHLLGFDHVRDADAVLMEAIETEILDRMGIADPYGGG